MDWIVTVYLCVLVYAADVVGVHVCVHASAWFVCSCVSVLSVCRARTIACFARFLSASVLLLFCVNGHSGVFAHVSVCGHRRGLEAFDMSPLASVLSLCFSLFCVSLWHDFLVYVGSVVSVLGIVTTSLMDTILCVCTLYLRVCNGLTRSFCTFVLLVSLPLCAPLVNAQILHLVLVLYVACGLDATNRPLYTVLFFVLVHLLFVSFQYSDHLAIFTLRLDAIAFSFRLFWFWCDYTPVFSCFFLFLRTYVLFLSIVFSPFPSLCTFCLLLSFLLSFSLCTFSPSLFILLCTSPQA